MTQEPMPIERVVLPEPAIRGSVSTRTIGDLMRDREPSYEHLFKPNQTTIGHFYIPPFQRPPVWSTEQSARLIESMHLGIAIGSIIVSDCGNTYKTVIDGKTVERFPDEADWLIDGRQRLNAIKLYMTNQLTVFVGTPHEHRYEDLSPRQRRRFDGTSMGYIRLEPSTTEQLAIVYDLCNFGGVAHTEDQRASHQVTS